MKNWLKPHKVVIYSWLDGVLSFEEKAAETFEHAMQIIEKAVCRVFKVYDCDGALVHSGNGGEDPSTYA